MARKKPEPKKSAQARTVPLQLVQEPPKADPAGAELARQEYRLADVSQLKLHPRNPKHGNVGAIAESVTQNKFYGAVYVQKSTGFILAGNHRWRAAVEKGLTKLPIIEIECDDDTAERILLGDNKIADLGTYDDRAVLALLEDQKRKAGTLAGTGYTEADVQRLSSKYAAPTKFPEVTERPKLTYCCPNCNHKWS